MNKLICFLMPLSLLLISGCSSWKPEKEIVTVDRIIKPTIAIQPHPTTLNLEDPKIIVITESNLNEVIDRVKLTQGEFVLYGLDAPSFKKLALNLEEIKRYIEQQSAIILYYEQAVSDEELKGENND